MVINLTGLLLEVVDQLCIGIVQAAGETIESMGDKTTILVGELAGINIAATLLRHGQIGHDLATAGPVAVNETWSWIRTDSAHHTVLWISEWPRSMVYPDSLSPILLSSGIQRSFSLICTPMRSDQVVRDIRKKKVEHISDQAQRAKIGQIEDAFQTAEYHDVLQQEADLTAGHGILRYTGLITITATTIEDLDAHVAALEQAAI